MHSASCGFRDHFAEFRDLKAEVFGLNTQTSEYPQEMAKWLQLPFEILSDGDWKLCEALRLPWFEADGMRLPKRLTLVIQGERIEHVFYPVFPPNDSATQVLSWLKYRPV